MSLVTILDVIASTITVFGAMAALINISRNRIFSKAKYAPYYPSKPQPAKLGCGGMLLGAIVGGAAGVLLPVSFVTLPSSPPGLGLIVFVAGSVIGFFIGAYVAVSVAGTIGGVVGACVGLIPTFFFVLFATLPGVSVSKSGAAGYTPPAISTNSAYAVVSSAVIIGVFVGYLAGQFIERAID